MTTSRTLAPTARRSAEPVPEVGPEEDADDEPVPPLVVLLALLDPVLQFRRLRRV